MYFVHALVDGSPVSVDLHYGDLPQAYRQAGALIEQGAHDVSISDGRGNRIEGDALRDCWQRGLRLKPDLSFD